MPESPTPPTSRSPAAAAALSLILPGLGQFYNGERAKGIAVLCISLSTWIAAVLSAAGPAAMRSPLSLLFLAVIYLFIWIPAIVDAYQDAAGRPSRLLSGGSAWYVIVMLLAVGPLAMPLLWQSRAFSRGAKIGWTIFVIAIAALVIFSMLTIGPMLEELISDPAFEEQLRADPALSEKVEELRGLLEQLR